MNQQQKTNVEEEEEKGFKSSSPSPSPTSSTAAAVVRVRPTFRCSHVPPSIHNPLIRKMASLSIGTRTTTSFKKKKTHSFVQPNTSIRRKVEMPRGLRGLRRICKYCGLHLQFWKESEGSFKVFNGIKTISVPPDAELVEYFCGGCGDGYVFDKPLGWGKP